jgi:hypothetical protein
LDPVEVKPNWTVYLIRDGILLQGIVKQLNADVRAGDGRLGLGKIVCDFRIPQNKGHAGDLLVTLYPFSRMLHPIGLLWSSHVEAFYFTPLQFVFDTGNWSQRGDSPDNFTVERSLDLLDSPEIDFYTPIFRSLGFHSLTFEFSGSPSERRHFHPLLRREGISSLLAGNS